MRQLDHEQNHNTKSGVTKAEIFEWSFDGRIQ